MKAIGPSDRSSNGQQSMPDFRDVPEDVDWIILATPDLNGTLRGKAVSAGGFADVLAAGGTTITDLIFATDAVDVPITSSVAIGPGSGAKDLWLRPELSTFCPLPWRAGWAWCLASALWRDGSPCDVSPRLACSRALESLRELGYEVRAAFEYEFRLHLSNGGPLTSGISYSQQQLGGPVAGFIEQLGNAAGACGLDIDAFHTEAGPGLVELNLRPAVGVTSADQALLLKSCISEIATASGLRASFLAKPVTGEEGSGGHLHLSLLDRAGANAFACEPRNGPLGETLRYAIGGLLENMSPLSPLYNPHINSYKRLIPGWFAPVRSDWAIDDRAAAVRVIAGADPRNTHIEVRRAGADANPYVVLAAAAASIALGLKGRANLPAPQAHDAQELPRDLRTALLAFQDANEIRDILGAGFCDQLEVAREWELSAWNDVVTDWEKARAEGPVWQPIVQTTRGS